MMSSKSRSNSNSRSRSRRNEDEEERLNNGVGVNSDDNHLHLFSHVLPSNNNIIGIQQQDLLQDPGGKHDYDWLLTPPGTPLFPSSTSNSTTNPSKLSISISDHNHSHSRSSRTTSLTRQSHSHNNNNNTYSSSRLSSSSILNTSSSSVSSYIRPSSPIPRSQSRPSTPSKPRSPATRPIPSRPATSHPPSAPPTRPLSRPSTPTRRNSTPSPSPSPARLTRNSASLSRPSSPMPRPRPTPHPIVPPDFPQHTPPNLRTTLPNRPLSAGRSRPNTASAATLKTNSETQASSANNISRRHSSPIVNRGRFTEPPAPKTRGYANSNGHHVDVPEPRKLSHAPEVGARRSVKSSTTTVTDNIGGFGRTISKKSLDMAIKHMDIRNSSGNLRALSNTTLFPQSIRSSAAPNPRSQSHRASSAPASINMNGSLVSSKNGVSTFDVRNNINRNMMINGREVLDERQQNSAKLSEVVDIYESSRYDALLLKEDLKNTDWLHSADDKCDQDSIFGNGFEHLPEPFGLL